MKTWQRIIVYVLTSLLFIVLTVVLFSLVYRLFGNTGWFAASIISLNLAIIVPIITFIIYYFATKKENKGQVYFGTLFIIYFAVALLLSVAGNVILLFAN